MSFISKFSDLFPDTDYEDEFISAMLDLNESFISESRKKLLEEFQYEDEHKWVQNIMDGFEGEI